MNNNIDLPAKVRYATLQAAREICRWRTKPDRGLEYLEPFFGIDSFNGVDKRKSDRILSLFSATVADCYREKGCYLSAAQWYNRTAKFSESCFFADCYADMVIKHKLSDFYADALICKERGDTDWISKHILERAFWWIMSLCMQLEHPWTIFELLSLKWHARRFKQYLKNCLEKNDLQAD